jgi:hypothetical protein
MAGAIAWLMSFFEGETPPAPIGHRGALTYVKHEISFTDALWRLQGEYVAA